MQQVAPFVNLGLTLTHGLVPPTPGILAVSILLGADIGTVIIIGLICSVISFVVCYLGLRPRASTSLRCPSTPRASRLWKTPTM